LLGFFSPQKATQSNGAAKPQPRPASSVTSSYPAKAPAAPSAPRPVRKPEAIEVTSAKLYVGNLSFDAAESDLSELFAGVGSVQSAEIVTHKHNEKSKGFGFVTMSSVEEAKRAVDVLHDKEFMGRKLVVSGAKTPVERS
jgi:RNA recognition motif-containing protein